MESITRGKGKTWKARRLKFGKQYKCQIKITVLINSNFKHKIRAEFVKIVKIRFGSVRKFVKF